MSVSMEDLRKDSRIGDLREAARVVGICGAVEDLYRDSGPVVGRDRAEKILAASRSGWDSPDYVHGLILGTVRTAHRQACERMREEIRNGRADVGELDPVANAGHRCLTCSLAGRVEGGDFKVLDTRRGVVAKLCTAHANTLVSQGEAVAWPWFPSA